MKMFICFVASGASLCGVLAHTPPRALIRASHLNHFDRALIKGVAK